MKRGEGGSKETASATMSVMMCIRSWLGSIKYAVTLSSPALMPRTTYRSDPRPCKDAPMLGLESHVIFARHCQIWSHITVMWALNYGMKVKVLPLLKTMYMANCSNFSVTNPNQTSESTACPSPCNGNTYILLHSDLCFNLIITERCLLQCNMSQPMRNITCLAHRW